MAYDKVVDSAALDTQLTSIADAIRAKTGGSDSLVFPDGFSQAIAAIEAGGGGGSATILGRTYECGTFISAEDQKNYQLEAKEIPTGAIYWTEEDWFADTTTIWKIAGFSIYSDVENGYGCSINISKDSASSTTSLNRSYAAGKTPSGSANMFGKPTSGASSDGTVISVYNYFTNLFRLGGTSGYFKAGVTYKYIIFYGGV